jgi:hypothetical protein
LVAEVVLFIVACLTAEKTKSFSGFDIVLIVSQKDLMVQIVLKFVISDLLFA